MIKVAIIGTGQIGFDLLHKIIKLDFVEIVAFVGRRDCTKQLPDNIFYSDKSIDFFISNPNICDVVFDCTDAYSAIINYYIFSKQKIIVIDLTPSNIGNFYIPNVTQSIKSNVNMVTCGGQVSIPYLNYIKTKINDITYIEVITQINSESAGIATRINIDKYIHTTEDSIKSLIGAPVCKVILNINPYFNTTMQTTIYVKTKENQRNVIFDDFNNFIESMNDYIENYNTDIPIWLSDNLLMAHVKITSSSDILSKYSGNLDIINCAAIHSLKKIYSDKQV